MLLDSGSRNFLDDGNSDFVGMKLYRKDSFHVKSLAFLTVMKLSSRNFDVERLSVSKSLKSKRSFM
jgi:hypothetical protein